MVGFDPESFWDQTIRTMTIAMNGKLRAARREHNQRAWLAWHVAALHRAKKLPTLKSMLARDKPRAQSWQEQSNILASWSLAHNGKVKRGNDG
jgi:hypothetical protein